MQSIGVLFRSAIVCWTLVLLCASLVLQLVGFVTPGWFVLKSAVWKVDIGLWYTLACKDECNAYSITEFVDSMMPGLGAFFENTLLEQRVESSIALATSLVSAITLVVARRYRNNKCYPWILVGVSLSSVLSGVLSLVASGKMGDHIRIEHRMHMQLVNWSPYLFPYSVLLTGLGGITACLAAILLVFKIHQLLRQDCENAISEPVAYSVSANHAVCLCSADSSIEPGSNTTTEEQNEINQLGGSCINSQKLEDAYSTRSLECEREKTAPSTVWSGLPKYTQFQ